MAERVHYTVTGQTLFGTEDMGETLFADLSTTTGRIKVRLPFHAIAKHFNGWRTARDLALKVQVGPLPEDAFEVVSPYVCKGVPEALLAQDGRVAVRVGTTENMPLSFVLTRDEAMAFSAALAFQAQQSQGPKPGH